MNQDTEYFTAGDAAKLIETTPEEVAYLGQIITPEVPATGSGYKSFYSFRNLVEMRLGEELSNLGVPWKRIYKYVDALRESRGQWLENIGLDGWLVLDSVWKWGVGTNVETAIASLSGLRSVSAFIAVDIGRIKQGIRRRSEGITDEGFKVVVKSIEEEGKRFKQTVKDELR